MAVALRASSKSKVAACAAGGPVQSGVLSGALLAVPVIYGCEWC